MNDEQNKQLRTRQSNEPMENWRIGSILCHLFYPTGKPEAPSARVIKGSQYNEYGFTLDALALNTSGFCNIRVTP
jgi:hypothetical protein